MNWHLTKDGAATVIVLDSDLGIQNAAAFYEEVRALAVLGGEVRLDAGSAKSVHSSIMQILYALSQAVPGFGVTAASADFLAAEVRVGFSLPRRQAGEASGTEPAGKEVPRG